MVKIARFFAYIAFFVLMLMYFTPKQNVYYAVEDMLKSESIIINKEDVKDNGLTLSINNADIYFESIPSAKVQTIKIKVFGLFNCINIENITLAQISESFIPLHVENLKIKYSVFNPLNITATGIGEFGELEASLSLSTKILHVEIKPSKLMLNKYKRTLQEFKKSENGEYVYEKAI